jgi:hypothetical protein
MDIFLDMDMSNNMISSGDVAKFPLKICCFLRGNIRYAFVFFYSAHMIEQDESAFIYFLILFLLIFMLAEKMSYYY